MTRFPPYGRSAVAKAVAPSTNGKASKRPLPALVVGPGEKLVIEVTFQDGLTENEVRFAKRWLSCLAHRQNGQVTKFEEAP